MASRVSELYCFKTKSAFVANCALSMNCCAGISKYVHHSETVAAVQYDFSQVEQSARNRATMVDLIGGKFMMIINYHLSACVLIHELESFIKNTLFINVLYGKCE